MTFAISVSRFSSVCDVKPVCNEMNWRDFTDLFSVPFIAPCTLADCLQSTCLHKRGLCWSPAVFADNVESRRSYAGVSLLVFDVNQATNDQIYEIRRRITAFRYLIHSTHSDRPCVRFIRIVIALSRQVSCKAWGTFWNAAHQAIAPIADLDCSDARRIYFFPSCPLDGHYLLQTNEGDPLDVDVVLAQAAVPSPVAKDEGRTLVVDQPPPVVTNRRPTWEIVMASVAQLPDYPDNLITLVLADMQERDAVGRARYGTPLTSGNGRDHLIDAYQECLDASVYLANELDECGSGLNGRTDDPLSGSWSKRKYLFDVGQLYREQIRTTVKLRLLLEEKKKLVELKEVP